MLILSFLVAAILLVSRPGLIAEEPNATPPDVPTLQIHKTRADDASSVFYLIKPLLSETRIATGPNRGEFVVFAQPAIQKSIVDAIAKHEQTALLFEQLDLEGADPKLVEQVVVSGMRAAPTDKQRTEADAFRFEFDRLGRYVRVWGRAAEIEFVKDAIAVLNKKKTSDAIGRTPIVRQPNEQELTQNLILDGGPVLAPDGPLQLVPIKGLDVLLIRGKRTDVERVFGR